MNGGGVGVGVVVGFLNVLRGPRIEGREGKGREGKGRENKTVVPLTRVGRRYGMGELTEQTARCIYFRC